MDLLDLIDFIKDQEFRVGPECICPTNGDNDPNCPLYWPDDKLREFANNQMMERMKEKYPDGIHIDWTTDSGTGPTGR